MFQPNLVRRRLKEPKWRTMAKSQEEAVSGCEVGCAENARDYLQNTSLHGLKYIGTTNITLFER